MKNNKTVKTLISFIMMVAVVCLSLALPGSSRARAEEEELPFNRVRVNFPSLTLELTDAAAERDKTYSFKLTADDAESPLPEKTVITMTEAGEAEFGSAVFSLPGDYYYSVVQTTEDEMGFVLDTRTYRIRVFAYLFDEPETGEDGKPTGEIKTPDKLAATVITGVEGETEKTEKIVFKNDYGNTSLIIEKTLSTKEQFEDGTDPVTFVFSVDVFWENELLRSDVVSMVFTGPGTDHAEVTDIPAGASVTVTEVYAGGNYRVVGDAEKSVVAGPEGATVEFENTYAETWLGGGSVINTLSGSDSGTGTYSDGRTETFGED